jgi:retron-type reverse transcriptase
MYDEQNFLFQQMAAVPALFEAWRKVRANRGAAGIDAVSLNTFAADLGGNLQELSRSLLSGAYQPLPARFVTVTKPNGSERELAILAVRDRVAQRAALDVAEPLLEPLFLDCSFAFRPGRNVEMAVQRMLAARANGYFWTVESDVQDFFGSVDQRLLLREVSGVLPDQRLLALFKMWLDGGELEPRPPSPAAGILRHGQETLAGVHLFLRDTINRSVDDFVNEKLGQAAYGSGDSYEPALDPGEGGGPPYAGAHAEQQRTRRAVVKRLVQDGALLALSQRALLGRLLSLKVLGVGGLAVGAAMLAPRALDLYRRHFDPRTGTLQGAPISPLLTNFYMTPFDCEMTERGLRLIRYCDDFVIQCRTEAEALAALQAAQRSLAGRGLQLHPAKTRLAPPDAELEFLGYTFTPDGGVIAPATVPEQMVRQIQGLARQAWQARRRAIPFRGSNRHGARPVEPARSPVKKAADLLKFWQRTEKK